MWGLDQVKPLEDSQQNLSQLAAYMRSSLVAAAASGDKAAVGQARQYTIDALASVAFQIHTAAQALVGQEERGRGDWGVGRERGGRRRCRQSASAGCAACSHATTVQLGTVAPTAQPPPRAPPLPAAVPPGASPLIPPSH